MANLIVKGLVFAGIIVLLHAAYEVANYRDLLKLQQEEYTQPPLTVVLELCASFACLAIGAYNLAGLLKPIFLEKGVQSMDAGSFRPDFVSFNKRSAVMAFDFAS